MIFMDFESILVLEDMGSKMQIGLIPRNIKNMLLAVMAMN